MLVDALPKIEVSLLELFTGSKNVFQIFPRIRKSSLSNQWPRQLIDLDMLNIEYLLICSLVEKIKKYIQNGQIDDFFQNNLIGACNP